MALFMASTPFFAVRAETLMRRDASDEATPGKANCTAFTSCPVTKVNKGETEECSGADASTCDETTCCQDAAHTAVYSFPTDVHKGDREPAGRFEQCDRVGRG